MDREARQEYNVVIQAKDMGGHMGGLSGTTEVKITLTDVNDNPPKFPLSECKHDWISVSSFHQKHLLQTVCPLFPDTRGERVLLNHQPHAVSRPAASHHLLHVRTCRLCKSAHTYAHHFACTVCVFVQPTASNLLKIWDSLQEAEKITWEINY